MGKITHAEADIKRPKTNSKLIVAFVMMFLIAYVILALALTCNGQEPNQIQRSRAAVCSPLSAIITSLT